MCLKYLFYLGTNTIYSFNNLTFYLLYPDLAVKNTGVIEIYIYLNSLQFSVAIEQVLRVTSNQPLTMKTNKSFL